MKVSGHKLDESSDLYSSEESNGSNSGKNEWLSFDEVYCIGNLHFVM